jgi:hypothetical protein
VATTVVLNLERGGGGRPVGWRHAAGEGQERGRERCSCKIGERCSTGSGPRPVGAGGVVRPCCAAGQTGEGEGADRWATTIVLGGYVG